MTSRTLAGEGILAVHAHPDDETLTHGGTLAAWARAGEPVTLVTCTRGEQGEVIPPELKHLEGDGAALAEMREQELAAAVAALGVREHFFLDQLPPLEGSHSASPAQYRYEDSGMVWLGHGEAGTAQVAASSLIAADLDQAAARLARHIRKLRPRFVLTYEPGGGYGHPDHVRAAEITVRAVEIAADDNIELGIESWRTPAVLGSVVPAAVLRAGRDALAVRHDRGEIGRASDLTPETSQDRLAALAREDDSQILHIDVSNEQVLAARHRALQAHRTQIQAVVHFAPDPGFPYLSGGFGLSNNYFSPLFSRDFYLPDPGWQSVEFTAADLVPPTSNTER